MISLAISILSLTEWAEVEVRKYFGDVVLVLVILYKRYGLLHSESEQAIPWWKAQGLTSYNINDFFIFWLEWETLKSYAFWQTAVAGMLPPKFSGSSIQKRRILSHLLLVIFSQILWCHIYADSWGTQLLYKWDSVLHNWKFEGKINIFEVHVENQKDMWITP